jgi:hypothetical protein
MATLEPKGVRRRRVYSLLAILLSLLLLAAYLWILPDNGPITLANYNRIPEGSTLEVAVKILGEPGEWRPVYPNGERPWKSAIWATKDGSTRICLVIGESGTVLWKTYSDDTLWNKALRSVGVNAPPKTKATTVKAP